MMIISRKSDGVVIHAADYLTLSEGGASGNGWTNRRATTENCSIHTVESLPADFICGAYAYLNGQFVAVNQSSIDANSAMVSGKNNGKAADAKRRQIIQQYDTAVNLITSGYDDQEISSWPQQADEARAKNANANADAPLVSAIAQARGMTIQEMVTRILAKEAQFKPIYGTILGRKQARLAALSAVDLTSPDAITQINAI